MFLKGLQINTFFSQLNQPYSAPKVPSASVRYINIESRRLGGIFADYVLLSLSINGFTEYFLTLHLGMGI